MKSYKYTIQTKEAQILMQLAGLSDFQIQNVLPDYKIKIFSKEANYALICTNIRSYYILILLLSFFEYKVLHIRNSNYIIIFKEILKIRNTQ